MRLFDECRKVESRNIQPALEPLFLTIKSLNYRGIPLISPGAITGWDNNRDRKNALKHNRQTKGMSLALYFNIQVKLRKVQKQ